MKKGIISIVLFITIFYTNAQDTVSSLHSEGSKVALVIGLSNYYNLPYLSAPVHDANDLSRVLKGQGFRVTLLINPSPREYQRGIAQFKKDVKNANVGLIYCSSHGCSFKNGKTCIMLPEAGSYEDWNFPASIYSITKFVNLLKEANCSSGILLFDICRTSLPNEYEDDEKDTLKIPSNFFIAYAAAADGPAIQYRGEKYSVFTGRLLYYMVSFHLSIQEISRMVRQDVIHRTNGVQVPEIIDSLKHSISFSVDSVSQKML
ncbi:MAG TPA: caspase family protein [Puia sp.]|nr:caspase family protein [Puia sp.]